MANSEVRIGRVSSVDYEAGMARVTYRDKDDTVTGVFPILNYNDEYRMPEIGQDVLVAHLSNGSSRGAIIGTLWNKKNLPKESGEKIYRKDLSRQKDGAYIRYSDETGEYLIKVANLHLNGVNKTILDGPMLEVSANISILLESDYVHMDMCELLLTGGESDTLSAHVETDVKIMQEANSLEASILKAIFEFVEGLEIKTGEDVKVESSGKTEISAASDLRLAGEEGVEISSGSSLRLSDGTYSVTLSEIMDKLNALGG